MTHTDSSVVVLQRLLGILFDQIQAQPHGRDELINLFAIKLHGATYAGAWSAMCADLLEQGLEVTRH